MNQSEADERIKWNRQRWSMSGNLTPEEIEEMIGYHTHSCPTTVKEQVRQHILLVKDNKPLVAEKFVTEITPLLCKDSFTAEEEIHDISLIVSKYVSGAHIFPDKTEEILAELSHAYPLPLKTLTRAANKPYRVWISGKSEIALWKAWRQGRPTVIGYGMTEQEAVNTLRYKVQPDHDGTLDGLGKPKGTLIGGNMLSPEVCEQHNQKQFV